MVTDGDIIALELERAQDRTQDIVSMWQALSTMREPIILGAFAWSALARRHRWIIKTGVTELIPDLWVTFSDVARSYLRLKYPKWKPRANSVQYHSTVKAEQPPPYYSARGSYASMVYLDMKSAYWQILQVGGWDVDYSRGRFIGFRSSVQDFPYPQLKLSRNSLVSVGLGQTMTYWDGSKLTVKAKKNPFTNKLLWMFVHDVLHGIAHEMVTRAGAVYVATDGYILPMSKLSVAADICAEWGGLVMRPKQTGDAIIGAARQYAIGGSKTVYMSQKGKPIVGNINPVELEWLKARYRSRAEKVTLIL